MIAGTLILPNRTDLHCHLWKRRDEQHRGAAILIHGLGDHGGSFRSFAERLLQQGLAVAAIDLPGHGRSKGPRGVALDFDAIYETLSLLRQTLDRQFGWTSHYVIGHSMGGNLAANYAIRRHEFEGEGQRAIEGVVLIAPMLVPPQHLDRSSLFAAWATGYLVPWVRIQKRADAKQLRSCGSERAFDDDPLRHSTISIHTATQLLAQGRFVLDHAREIDTPTLVIYGDQDELIDQTACRHFALRAGHMAESICWSNGLHDLMNDRDAESICDRLWAWMERSSSNCKAA
ncbi:alpha/beta hydrolase [Stieleria sp. JC731]|nr:alpha/beta fold hydrolase [Stieleria sp. JC731]MCC9600792.1 alpha/beta hydrolase [Stieleria sp. JC731]